MHGGMTAVLLSFLVAIVPAQTWVARYNGPANDEDQAYAIGCDALGRVFVTGKSWDAGTGADILTIAYGQAGESLWAVRYDGGAGGDDAAGAMVVAGGRLVVTGGVTSSSVLTDVYTASYQTDGAVQWSAVYDGAAAGNDLGLCVALDSSGNTFVAGFMTGDTTGWDFVILKYDASGNRQWVGTYATADEDYVAGVAADANGNVYATGCSGSPYTLSWDWVTAKYNPGAGDTVWTRRVNGPADSDDQARAIAVDDEGNVIVAGGTTSLGTGVDCTTIKYRPNGDTLWMRCYDGPAGNADWANALAVDGLGNVYVAGSSMGNGTDLDYITIKYSPSGEQLWTARYDGPAGSFDEARAIAVDAGGNVYVTGASTGEGTRSDYATVKYDASGNQVWVSRYDGPAGRLDEAVAIALDNLGGVCVTGGSVGSGTGISDYATVRYPCVGIEEAMNDERGTMNVGATIVRGVLNLEAYSRQHTACRAELLDISGRSVMTLKSGANDVSRLAPGIYFLRGEGREAGAVGGTRKLVIPR